VRDPGGRFTISVPAPWHVHTPQSCEQKAEWVTQHFPRITYTTVSNGPTTLGGLAAYAHTHTWKASTGETRWSRQICVVQQGKVCVHTATTTGAASGLPGRTATLTPIVNSFHLMPASTPTRSPSTPTGGASVTASSAAPAAGPADGRPGAPRCEP